MPEKTLPPFPPLPAFQGLACYKCFREDDVNLSRCTGCLRISYCGTGASGLDWDTHKPMCKALSALEKRNPVAAATLLSSLPSGPTTDVQVLNRITQKQISNILDFCRPSLQRQKTLFEQELVVFEPRCMVCTRTDQLIRMKATRMGATTDNSRRLTPCPHCRLSFCCSPAHWEAARMLHHSTCEDAPHDSLSQCAMNSELRIDIKFVAVLADENGHFEKLRWAPPRINAAWMPLAASSWEAQFGDELRSLPMFMGLPASFPLAPMIRVASDELTMPMTILYALEKLNDDDRWTRSPTLTVHIIGASRQREVIFSMVFEEILHRLPDVKILKIVLCGPDMLGHSAVEKTFSAETCSLCTQRGRKLTDEHAFDLWQKKGSNFEKPDLCIAFNSGASQVSQGTWQPTFKLLAERKIPTVFTSYDRNEAECEAALMRAAGAKLHPGLEPVKNPWGSLNAHPAEMKVYGFYAGSGWLAGGFR
ncbi:hypothetical protein DFH06DRAFT_994915 [Mycena polygramma]|nr:hypothetical protein DFH06DRAFT_994915 [Mycena polygramma]